jgi:hypothetical protein
MPAALAPTAELNSAKTARLKSFWIFSSKTSPIFRQERFS